MQKLNELVEQAKEISSKNWFINSDEEVTAIDNDAGPDDSEEVFIGCAANIQLAKYITSASPETILAIAEAFRALEQEKEAADRYAERLNTLLDDRDATLSRYEAKLAELEKQKPVGTVSIAMDWNTHRNVATVNMRHDLVVSEMKDGDELFTRPAPAADRVPEGWKLVPVEITQEMVDANFEGVCIGGIQAGYRAMLAAAPEVGK